MDDLYREQIIDRFKNPKMRGVLDPHDYSYEDDNPLCGDRIRVDVRVDGQGIITEAAYSGEGCAISQASADLLTESVVGKSLDQVKSLNKDDHSWCRPARGLRRVLLRPQPDPAGTDRPGRPHVQLRFGQRRPARVPHRGR